MAKKNNKKNNNKKNNNNNKNIKSEQVSSTKKSSAANDLLKKYGLEEDQDKTTAKVETVEAQKEDTKKVKGKVKSLADDIGWNKPKVLLRNFCFGIFMGASDGVPGYSGGTTLNLIGFYKQLVDNVKLIFKPDVKKYFWKYLLWFLPFLISWIGILVGFMFLVKTAGEHDRGVVLSFLFGSFALFSIPLFFITNKQKTIDFKDFWQATKKKEKWPILHWVLIILAFLIIVAIGIIARFVSKVKLIDGTIVEGVTFASNIDKSSVAIDTTNTVATVIPLLILSIVAGFAILIPGLSGSLIIFMGGWYAKISSMASDFISGAHGATDTLPFLFVLPAGMLIGVIISVMSINWLLNKYEKHFYSASTGFVCGAFIAIFVSLSSYDYGFLAKDNTTMGLSIGMIFVALVVNLAIFILLNETKKINYPKFKIFNRNQQAQAQKVKH